MGEQQKMQAFRRFKTVGDWEYRKGILLAIGMPSSMTMPNSLVIDFRIGR
jgi:hypothetical protein